MYMVLLYHSTKWTYSSLGCTSRSWWCPLSLFMVLVLGKKNTGKAWLLIPNEKYTRARKKDSVSEVHSLAITDHVHDELGAGAIIDEGSQLGPNVGSKRLS